MTLPLEGIKVLDVSQYLPGPLCTQILADYGAEVVKVESLRGELGRTLEPVIGKNSSRFYSVNRNKKSITIDFKNSNGKEVFKNLVKTADVLVDQFRPGVMDKLGIGYDVLKEVNPRLVYCSLSGYGLTGPMVKAAGHDINYLNVAGISGLTGTAEGTPAMSSVQFADVGGGTYCAVIAILLALAARDRTGKGQLCDVAMMDGSLYLLAYALGEMSGSGLMPEMHKGTIGGGYPCYNNYETKDHRYVSCGMVEGKFYKEFVEKLGHPEYFERQYDDSQADIFESIKAIMLTKTQAEWVEFFAESDICFSPVLNIAEVLEHPQVKARELITKVENVDNSGKDVLVVTTPVKLSETPAQIKLVFPGLGEHNKEQLLSAGYTEAEIKKLEEEKAV